MIRPLIVAGLLTRVRPARETAEPDEPFRAERFSVERLEQHAESLAMAQRVSRGPRAGQALERRVRENGRVLLHCYRALAEASREEGAIAPAAEWLVDNYYIVDEQLRDIRDHLPRRFYRELPKLAEGHLEGYPRVLGLAWAFVAHTDSRFDPDVLRRFVHAYQRVGPLLIGELWAVAITLRIVLVENLRRLAERIVNARAERQRADRLADGLLGIAGRGTADEANTALRRLGREPLPRSFAVQLVQRLREQDPTVVPALRWLDEQLGTQHTTTDVIVREDHQAQAAMNVTVRNVITSMRLMSAFDWKGFFESVSLVDEALRGGSTFADMDFTTRDRYRHAIEQMARLSSASEIDVARRAVLMARKAGDGATERQRDPGYYLIARGRKLLEAEIGFRAGLRRRLLRAYIAAGTPAYLGTIAALSAVFVATPLLYAAGAGMSPLALVLFALLALFPAAELAIALTNRGVTERLRPAPLAKLALRDGVPANLRTLVVVPTLLTSEADARAQIDQLEIHYLANPDDEMRFALASDWTDAPAETMPEDETLLAAARDAIAQLNARHGPAPDGEPRFFLFHRRRMWNEGESAWIGWERKRGKLHELNRLLRGATDTSFLLLPGPPAPAPQGVRYVITLDADTRLPGGAARQLIGTMAHPLNAPRLDATACRVVEGYGVLQPRITPTLPEGGDPSLYQRAFSGPCGIDPYASAVSDVYQDLFGEGSYTGKGIYAVDAFEAALAGRVPENTLLSHDLFEGLFARAGLVTDVSLFEEFPSNYLLAAVRQHRWARGDWQLLPWIVGRSASHIPVIGRWKMLDNLRRTLLAPAVLVLLVAGWVLPAASPSQWTTFVVATLLLTALVPVLHEVVPRRRGISKRSHVRGVLNDTAVAVTQVALTLTLLAHQAWLMTDAIGRTLVRLVTRRHLLEWVTAAQAKARHDLMLATFVQRMGAGVLVAAGVAVLVVFLHAAAWPWPAPFVALWLLSPVVAWAISRPMHVGDVEPLADDQVDTLRVTARRTWHFFATFVGQEDHALPPDNFQEDPAPVVAHRTSPTNIGLYLLSTLAAHDFGWLGLLDTADRLTATFDTLRGLERFHGHFYNWYETRGPRPLDPKYVSTVDSGNLAGHLLTLREAFVELQHRPLLGPQVLTGIADTVLVLRETLRAAADEGRTLTVSRKDLSTSLDAIVAALEPAPDSPAGWAERLSTLQSLADTTVDIARTLSAERGETEDNEVVVWANAIHAVVASHVRDLDTLLPWARSDAEADALPAALRAHVPSPARATDVLEAMGRDDASPATEAVRRSVAACAEIDRRLATLCRV